MEQLNNKKSFTLIELLIVTTIIGILSVITFPYYRSTSQKLALQRSANRLAQDIRRAQEMAMSARELPGGGIPDGYGIYIKAQTGYGIIYLYADTSAPAARYDSGDQIIETIYKEEDDIYVEKEILVEDILLEDVLGTYNNRGEVSINFKPPDPVINLKDETGKDWLMRATIKLCLEGSDCTNPENYKRVRANRVGLIYVK